MLVQCIYSGKLIVNQWDKKSQYIWIRFRRVKVKDTAQAHIILQVSKSEHTLFPTNFFVRLIEYIVEGTINKCSTGKGIVPSYT
jgi:hypothetical protein